MRRVQCRSLKWIEHTTPRLVDAVLDPLLARAGLDQQRMGIADLREGWEEATSRLVLSESSGKGLTAIGGRFINWTARRSLRARTSALEQLLADIENRGHDDLSAESVKACLSDKLVSLARLDARQKLAIVDGCGYALSLVLVSMPLLLLTVSGGST